VFTLCIFFAQLCKIGVSFESKKLSTLSYIRFKTWYQCRNTEVTCLFVQFVLTHTHNIIESLKDYPANWYKERKSVLSLNVRCTACDNSGLLTIEFSSQNRMNVINQGQVSVTHNGSDLGLLGSQWTTPITRWNQNRISMTA